MNVNMNMSINNCEMELMMMPRGQCEASHRLDKEIVVEDVINLCVSSSSGLRQSVRQLRVRL